MNKYRIIKDYLNYYFRAKTKHSIHSPFVFEFITKVLNQKTLRPEQFTRIEKLRKDMLVSSNEINVIDFGAGGVSTQTKVCKVSDIARNSAKSKKYAHLLCRIIAYYNLRNILELGTSAGISSMYIATASPEIKLTTIEGCPETARLAEEKFKSLQIKNIYQIIGNFDVVLPEVLKQENHFDCIFFDGNHREGSTIRYFEQSLPHIGSDSVFIFDDINWSEGMKLAWNNIKNHPSVTVTIDLFFIGIVFFRKELSKEDFVIRF
jgi:predicted O-methyltransferase YrrM